MLTEEPNGLTYHLAECTTKRRVHARFFPMEISDQNEIEALDWRGVFTPLWKQIVETEPLRKRAYKMVCNDLDVRIQGLLFLGMDRGKDWSLDCLLETAPWNRYGRIDRLYCGVGKALVARIIAEHWHLGHRTPIQIEINARSQVFYQHLGFIHIKPAPKANRLFLLDAPARSVFESVVKP